MTQELTFLATISLIFILTLFYLSLKPTNNEQPKQTTTPKTKHKSDEIIDTLEWMLSRGIITNEEYNKLIVKCLPFLE